MAGTLDFLPWRPTSDLLSVAVLVELSRAPGCGGHVKCWERFAEAAAELTPGETGVDLTVYVLGQRPRVEPLSSSVRYVALPAVVGTGPLTRTLGATVGTDLAPYHLTLGRLLPHHDVWHLTHTFAFAATALRRAASQRGRSDRSGLVASVHTDVPALTAAYVRQLTARLTPSGMAETVCSGRWAPQALGARAAGGVRDRVLRACDRVLVPTEAQRQEIAGVVGPERVALLGRGMDRGRFGPRRGARLELAARYGVPEGQVCVLFAGRVDDSKRVTVVAEAVRRLRRSDYPVRLVVAGEGPAQRRVAALLGGGATLLGTLPQETMARVYSACDVFAFPSRSETAGNVVAEAMACHLPVVLPAGARTTTWLARPGRDGLVVENDDVAGWAAALALLVESPGLRELLGKEAGASARQWMRSWRQVFTEDLLPVWRGALPWGVAR